MNENNSNIYFKILNERKNVSFKNTDDMTMEIGKNGYE